MMSRCSVESVCPFCGTGCGLRLQTEADTVVSVQPVSRHPVSLGQLCIKGWNTPFALNPEDRIRTPLIREGKHFRPASWEEAIEQACKWFSHTQQHYGTDSVGFISCARATNEDNYAVQKLARAAFKTNNVDHCARICHSPSVAGLKQTLGSGAMTNRISDIHNADLIVIWGCDPTENHTVIGGQIIQAKLKGAQLIVVDPRKTRLAHLADHHLQLHLGSNIALVNGILHVIFKEGWEAETFLQNRCDNLDALKASVAKIDLDEVEAITGISPQQVALFAKTYSHAQSAFLAYGMGITQYATGTNNVIALSNLVLSCGHIGRPGTGINPLRGQNNVQGACDMGALPNVYPGYQGATDAKTLEKFSQAWDSTVAHSPGLTSMQMTETAIEGGFKALMVFGEDPVVTDPDQNRVGRAFNALDCLVVVDLAMTETAKMADIILPAVSFAEKDGTFTNCERRVQRVRKAIPPFADALSDWQICQRIARGMGHHGFEWPDSEAVFDEMTQLTPIYQGMSYPALDNSGLQWPCNSENPEGSPFLYQQTFPIGKARLVPVSHHAVQEPTDADYPFALTTQRVHFQYGCGSMTRKSPLLEREIPPGVLFINQGDAERLGVTDFAPVRISSRRGFVETRALLTDDLPEGLVSMPYHFKEAPSNQLTNTAMDPVTHMPELKACAVKVQKLPKGHTPIPTPSTTNTLYGEGRLAT